MMHLSVGDATAYSSKKLSCNNCRYCLQNCDILWLTLCQEACVRVHVIRDLFHGQLNKISKYIFVCKLKCIMIIDDETMVISVYKRPVMVSIIHLRIAQSGTTIATLGRTR